MQRYLNQLLSDLEAVTRQAPNPGSYPHRFRSFDDDDGDSPLLYTQRIRLVDLFNLDPFAFPPQDRLTKKQLSAVLKALENLWRAWNISWECPPNLTARRRYAVMVDSMRSSVSWHTELGTEIDFCAHREEGKCPFGDKGKCWCKEAEDTAAQDAAIWEAYHKPKPEEDKTDPIEELGKWLYPEAEEMFPWEIDEEKERWQQFTADEDQVAWLYFYRPDAHEDEFDQDEPSPEDYEDFEWESPEDEPESDFPF